ncbi:MAG: hypothetical protein ACM3XM_21185 [Mycobacterium leprae]
MADPWIGAVEQENRSTLMQEAVRIYVQERKKRDMREQMKRGYQEMARINLTLAEEGPVVEGPAVSRGGFWSHE